MPRIIDRDDLAAARRSDLHAIGGDLAPAAGRRAEIDDALTGLQNAILVVDLDELVGGARAISIALCGGDVGIVELTLEPALRRRGMPAAPS